MLFAGSILLLASLSCMPLAAQQRLALDRVLFEPVPLSAPVAAQDNQVPMPLLRMQESGRNPPAPLPARRRDADTNRTIAQYQEQIAAAEAAAGPFAPSQLESFLALGRLYQQLGDHEAALEALGKAEYISRINSGLFAPEQVAIVQAMVQSYLATGNLTLADERQQYLVFIQKQFYGDDSEQVVPALETLGDWNMDAFRSLLNQHNASGFQLGLNSRAGGTINMPNPRVLAFSNLRTAQHSYSEAIGNLLTQRRFRDPMLPLLELQLIETLFLGANREGILDDPDFYLDRRGTGTDSRRGSAMGLPLAGQWGNAQGSDLYFRHRVTVTGSRITRRGLSSASPGFAQGRDAWTRMRLYLENNPANSPVEVASAIIGMGDWHMLFNRRPTALDYYREARAYLQEKGVQQSMIDAMLSPAIPQQLPGFTPLPHSRSKFGIAASAPVDYQGYIDVSFRISRYGNVRNLKIVNSSEEVESAVERRLKRLLHSTPFRPRLTDGEPRHLDEVTLRYYYAMIEP